MKKSTMSIHFENNLKEKLGTVTTPIFQSSAYLFPFKDEPIKYPRYSNLPNQNEVIGKVCNLEGAEDGFLFGSGLAAVSAVFFSVLKPGDHLIIQDQIYGGTYSLVEGLLKDHKIEITYYEFSKDPDFSHLIKSNTKAVYIETPSNPLMKIVDIPKVAEIAKNKGLLSIIDNTFATPINQNPISFGIDVVIHSATKYLNGHSDLSAGVAVGKKDFIKILRKNARDLGGTTNDLTAFLLSRGMKTLSIRVEKHNFNALRLAEYLETHKLVEKVYYPGLESFVQHSLAKKIMKGFGGMLSFELKGTNTEIDARLSKLKYFSRAVSLGGVESLLCLPFETSHSYLTQEERLKLGIKDNLIRVSVGIEDIADLIEDWSIALG